MSLNVLYFITIMEKTQIAQQLHQSIKMTAIANDDEMALSEHIEEFSQRLVFCVNFNNCYYFLFCRC